MAVASAMFASTFAFMYIKLSWFLCDISISLLLCTCVMFVGRILVANVDIPKGYKFVYWGDLLRANEV